MYKDFAFTVDVKTGFNNPVYTVNMNDLKTLKFTITINQNNVALNLTGTTIRLAILKPDKKTVFQDCAITNATAGICEIILDSQSYSIDGNYSVEVMIYSGLDQVAVTSKFSYISAKGILNNQTVESANEWQSINHAILNLTPIIGNGSPTSIPSRLGQEYLDIQNKKVFKAFGITSTQDWIEISASAASPIISRLIDGGNYTTSIFSSIVDGGNYTTTLFNSTIDGGTFI